MDIFEANFKAEKSYLVACSLGAQSLPNHTRDYYVFFPQALFYNLKLSRQAEIVVLHYFWLLALKYFSKVYALNLQILITFRILALSTNIIRKCIRKVCKRSAQIESNFPVSGGISAFLRGLKIVISTLDLWSKNFKVLVLLFCINLTNDVFHLL